MIRRRSTIHRFAEQWTRYPDNHGYYGSVGLLEDIFGPLLNLEELKGARVADIGSGTGRIVNMLLASGVAHVLAIEPSDAFTVLKQNTAAHSGRVSLLHATGEAVPADGHFDFIFSIGVLHHTDDPGAVVSAAFRALKPGGRMLAWLYGREGNEFYLSLIGPVRTVTTRLPAPLLGLICHVINSTLAIHISLSRVVRLPLHRYVRNVLGKLSWRKRHLVIYDQLSPTIAEYYTESRARQVLERAGFEDVRLYHRHGYSWTVIGTKPDR
jgi:SAM-dependent methyltransferase